MSALRVLNVLAERFVAVCSELLSPTTRYNVSRLITSAIISPQCSLIVLYYADPLSRGAVLRNGAIGLSVCLSLCPARSYNSRRKVVESSNLVDFFPLHTQLIAMFSGRLKIRIGASPRLRCCVSRPLSFIMFRSASSFARPRLNSI